MISSRALLLGLDDAFVAVEFVVRELALKLRRQIEEVILVVEEGFGGSLGGFGVGGHVVEPAHAGFVEGLRFGFGLGLRRRGRACRRHRGIVAAIETEFILELVEPQLVRQGEHLAVVARMLLTEGFERGR